MNKLIISCILTGLTINLYASDEDRAIASFKKNCKSCHGSAYYVAKVLTEEEWLTQFRDNAKKLEEAHKNIPKAMDRFNSSYFRVRLDALKDFLAKNAADMGTVPPCNINTCGFDLGTLKKEK